MSDTASVSIIIPTLNESKTLARTLRQLTVLDPPAKEVIVVDGGSQDDTVAIAQDCQTAKPTAIRPPLFSPRRQDGLHR